MYSGPGTPAATTAASGTTSRSIAIWTSPGQQGGVTVFAAGQPVQRLGSSVDGIWRTRERARQDGGADELHPEMQEHKDVLTGRTSRRPVAWSRDDDLCVSLSREYNLTRVGVTALDSRQSSTLTGRFARCLRIQRTTPVGMASMGEGTTAYAHQYISSATNLGNAHGGTAEQTTRSCTKRQEHEAEQLSRSTRRPPGSETTICAFVVPALEPRNIRAVVVAEATRTQSGKSEPHGPRGVNSRRKSASLRCVRAELDTGRLDEGIAGEDCERKKMNTSHPAQQRAGGALKNEYAKVSWLNTRSEAVRARRLRFQSALRTESQHLLNNSDSRKRRKLDVRVLDLEPSTPAMRRPGTTAQEAAALGNSKTGNSPASRSCDACRDTDTGFPPCSRLAGKWERRVPEIRTQGFMRRSRGPTASADGPSIDTATDIR
ncbi:hypothetical protein C8T65DRAFT_697819 [Cerioporus squamosus]|nr:hypothetical protein C8T65DRAFT_697819 [Cerioporus squamosus]